MTDGDNHGNHVTGSRTVSRAVARRGEIKLIEHLAHGLAKAERPEPARYYKGRPVYTQEQLAQMDNTLPDESEWVAEIEEQGMDDLHGGGQRLGLDLDVKRPGVARLDANADFQRVGVVRKAPSFLVPCCLAEVAAFIEEKIALSKD
jgi:hypothetical protein